MGGSKPSLNPVRQFRNDRNRVRDIAGKLPGPTPPGMGGGGNRNQRPQVDPNTGQPVGQDRNAQIFRQLTGQEQPQVQPDAGTPVAQAQTKPYFLPEKPGYNPGQPDLSKPMPLAQGGKPMIPGNEMEERMRQAQLQSSMYANGEQGGAGGIPGAPAKGSSAMPQGAAPQVSGEPAVGGMPQGGGKGASGLPVSQQGLPGLKPQDPYMKSVQGVGSLGGW